MTHTVDRDSVGILELSDEQIELVSGALGIGAVSSDAVFGAGVGLLAAGAAITLVPGGQGLGIGFGFVGGALIGWGIVP